MTTGFGLVIWRHCFVKYKQYKEAKIASVVDNAGKKT